MLPLAMAVLLSTAAEVRGVSLTSVDRRLAVQLVTSEDVPVAVDVREGVLVLLRVEATAPAAVTAPEARPPLERIRLEREGESTVVSIKLAPAVRFETRHEPGVTTVVFGEPQPLAAANGDITPELYAQLFPHAAPPTAPGESEVVPAPDARPDGLSLGRILLQPSFAASWSDADVTFSAPQPVRDRYLQLLPGLVLTAPLFDGQLALRYEPRVRLLSSIDELNGTSHFAGATLALPVGRRVNARFAHSYTHATLEANVVDPGREYFYDLAPFTYQESSLALDLALGPRLYAVAEGSVRWARFDPSEPGGFFDFDRRAIRAGLGYDLRADLKAELSYGYERVPPPLERVLAETAAHEVAASLSGAIGPLMTGSLRAGFRTQESPEASGRSRRYDGVVFGGALRREIGRTSSLELDWSRSTRLSAFETNAYYLSSSASVALTLPFPLRSSARGSLLWLDNDYPNAASELGSPRSDRILGWTAGLGRSLGPRAWLRLDYRRERRDSNLPGFDVTTDGFVVQAGLRFRGAVSP